MNRLHRYFSSEKTSLADASAATILAVVGDVRTAAAKLRSLGETHRDLRLVNAARSMDQLASLVDPNCDDSAELLIERVLDVMTAIEAGIGVIHHAEGE